MIQVRTDVESLAPKASRKRRLLAVYLDMLLFGALWTLATLWLKPYIDNILLRLAVFALLESVLIPFRYSPGLYMLSVYRYPGVTGGYLGVDPNIKRGETWFTLIAATLLLNDGTKAMVRWTTGTPVRPYFGTFPDSTIAPLADIAFGCAEVFVAYAIFKLTRAGFWSALALAACLILSTVLSWELYPEYVEAYGRYRAERFGRTYDARVVEFMTPVVTAGTVAVSALFGGVVIANRKRFANELHRG